MAIFNFSATRSPQPGPLEPGAEARGDGPRFLLKPLLAILTMATALAAWHWGVDRGKGLAPGIFAETFQLSLPHPPAAVVPKALAIRPIGNGKMPPVSAVFVDDSNNLDSFYAALWKLEQGQQGQDKAPGVVTILHYGDSPTTADMITGDVRAQLQSRFGDAGRGYTLIAKPWAWYGHRGVEMSDHGWKIRTGVGLMREGVYGLGGAAFEGQAGANVASDEVGGGGRVAVMQDGDHAAGRAAAFALLELPEGAEKRVELVGGVGKDRRWRRQLNAGVDFGFLGNDGRGRMRPAQGESVGDRAGVNARGVVAPSAPGQESGGEHNDGKSHLERDARRPWRRLGIGRSRT